MKQQLLVVALVLGGCGVGEVEGVSAQALPGDPDCDPLNCPGNSDLAALLGPYELDETGVELSTRGFRITGMKHLGVPVQRFEVSGASIYIATANGTFTGPGVVGLRLTLEHEPTQRSYEIAIEQAYNGHVPYYANVPPASEIDGYYILYNEVGSDIRKELCPYADQVDHGVEGSWAVFWKGDRIEPVTAAIIASDDAVGPWFNISCAGEATIKMLRARTGGAVAPASPVSQRQATLNMFMAAYCGPTGDRYTQLGQEIAWSDLSGPSNIGAVSSFEAVWDEGGAVCLNKPRLVKRGEVACQIQVCTKDMVSHWSSYGWLLSGNP